MLLPHQPDASSKETITRIPTKHLDSIKSLGLHYDKLGKAHTEVITLPGEEVEFVAKISGESANPALAEKDAAAKYCGWKPEDNNNPTKETGNDWPKSRCASITISGISAFTNGNSEKASLENGLIPIAPGEVQEYQWLFDEQDDSKNGHRKQAHLFFSHGAPAGGEGDLKIVSLIESHSFRILIPPISSNPVSLSVSISSSKELLTI